MTEVPPTSVATISGQGHSSSDWQPVSGRELRGLLSREFPDSQDARFSIEQSTLRVLSRCVDPTATEEANTGLVVGYVQSGKTLSFTAVTAAAHDNGYRLVIVVAGSTHILASQSRDRLMRDLNVTGGALRRPWRHFHNPDSKNLDSIRSCLESWKPGSRRSKTVLVTLLKNRSRIDHLSAVLESMPPELLGAALIIDDEADQASLNNRVKKGQRSPTYRALLDLKKRLPTHTYLQYTATPQANVFIPLIDLLSPDFCQVLEPGKGYVGGRTIFRDRVDDLVSIIPPRELQNPNEAPPSLFRALRSFLLGVAQALIEAETTYDVDPQNRSMLVHPSRLKEDHRLYYVRINAALSNWSDLLAEKGEPDRVELVRDFEEAYRDLSKSCTGLEPFDKLMEWIPEAIHETEVQYVNSLSDIASWDKEWRQHYAWILVGGQKLDRGFTVEGLTVTYMPRGKGVGYADTIQQRGRFFGYKAGYLDLCRVHLEADVKRAFEVYVESEESMRAFLGANGDLGRLKRDSLRRQFQMDRTLQPTRRSILLDVPVHMRVRASGWVDQTRPHEAPDLARENGDRIKAFLERSGLTPRIADAKSEWLREPSRARPTHIHEVLEDLTVEVLYGDLLPTLLMSSSHDDREWQVALALAELAAQREPKAPAAIVWMQGGAPIRRGTKANGAISQLFQGAYPRTDGAVYGGDRSVHLGKMTLQVRTLDIFRGKADKKSPPVWPSIPTVALWLSPDNRADFITQAQGA